ncbi:MAG: ATP-dependent sacrificial sulfur transferase LarE [Candidatus Firestonebacteria bacterium]|nr:ATP-dependent sacrificial sulfur transferase LarE [Candidatus Firestonebacteria bacterium]
MDKLDTLQQIFKKMGSVLVAYSGGADSTFLLKVALDSIGENVLAVTSESETYTSHELENAKSVAMDLKAKHVLIHTDELNNKEFIRNTPDRCYYCKKELFSNLLKIAKENNINFVVDGANIDDTRDYRPGHKASLELGIRSPLIEAKFTKEDIREYSKKFRLPTWDKPSQACLSSRVPYGEQITIEKLKKINLAEMYLKNIGFQNVRVRFYSKELARIEVGKNEIEKANVPEIRNKIVSQFKKIGFKYITLDLEGFRSGSMNEVLDHGDKGNIIH